jgi:hypothetical protein
MSYLETLKQQRDELSNKWKYHIDEFDRVYASQKKKYEKLDRDINKQYHLASAKNKMFDEICDMLENWSTSEELHERNKEVAEKRKKWDRLWNLIEKNERNVDILKFELQLNDYVEDIHHAEYNKYMNKMDTIHHLTKKNCKVVCVKLCEIQQLEKEDCCICLTPHTWRDVVTTSCGHRFGKSCMEKLIEEKHAKECEIVCPLCRNNEVKFTIYCKKA